MASEVLDQLMLSLVNVPGKWSHFTLPVCGVRELVSKLFGNVISEDFAVVSRINHQLQRVLSHARLMITYETAA